MLVVKAGNLKFTNVLITFPDAIAVRLPSVRVERQAAGKLKDQDQEETGGKQGGWTAADQREGAQPDVAGADATAEAQV